MAAEISEQQIKNIIMRELPRILEQDSEVRGLILRLSARQFADKQETESHFDRLLDELRRDREEQARKWEEHRVEDVRKWEEDHAQDVRKWEEHRVEEARKREEDRVEEASKWEDQNRKWEEHRVEEAHKWEDQNRKWDENQRTINRILDEIHALSHKHDSTLGALGARWGLYSEQSFRNALKGILEESFGVQVLNVVEYDGEGQVFGRPDQIELDLVIKDGLLIICEIKSSMSKADMVIFDRKVKFYEQQHQRQAARTMVISPMVDARAQAVAKDLGIQVYSYAQDIEPGL